MDNILKEFEADEKVIKLTSKINDCTEKASKWQKKADEASSKAKEYQFELERYISSKKLVQAQELENNAKKHGLSLEELTLALETGDFSSLERKIKNNVVNEPDDIVVAEGSSK